MNLRQILFRKRRARRREDKIFRRRFYARIKAIYLPIIAREVFK